MAEEAFSRPEQVPEELWRAQYDVYRAAYKRFHKATVRGVPSTVQKNKALLHREKEKLEYLIAEWKRQQQVAERLGDLASQAQTNHFSTQQFLARILEVVAPPQSASSFEDQRPLSEDTCVYCLEEVSDASFRLSCNHQFHLTCFLTHVVSQADALQCPICRAESTETDRAQVAAHIQHIWEARRGPAAREFLLLNPLLDEEGVPLYSYHRTWRGAATCDGLGRVALPLRNLSIVDVACSGDEIHEFLELMTQGRWPKHGDEIVVRLKGETLPCRATFCRFRNLPGGAELEFLQSEDAPSFPNVALAKLQSFQVTHPWSFEYSLSWNRIVPPPGDPMLNPPMCQCAGQKGIFVPHQGFQGPAGTFTLAAVEDDPVAPRLVLLTPCGEARVSFAAYYALFPVWLSPERLPLGARGLPVNAQIAVRFWSRLSRTPVVGHYSGCSKKGAREFLHIVRTLCCGHKVISTCDLDDIFEVVPCL